MVNQINTNPTVFAPLRSNGVPYAITKPITKNQEKNNQKEEDKKSNKLGYNIAKVALIVGFGVLALAKGLPKSARGKITEFFKYMDTKTLKLGENQHKLSGVQKVYYETLKFIKPLVNNTKSIFTLASLKDVFVKKMVKLVPALDRAGDKITALFERISVKTSRKAYMATLDRSERLFADFEEASGKISDKAQAEKLSRRVAKIKNHYIENFSEAARNKRLIETKNNMDSKSGSLYDHFWNVTYGDWKTFIKNKDSYTTFIPEKLVEDAKQHLIGSVKTLREGFSISFVDNYRDAKNLVNNIASASDPTDEASRTLLKNIRTNLEKCKKNGAFDTETQKLILTDLQQLKNKIPESNAIKECMDVVSLNKQGELQNIMDEYKKALSPKDYKKLEKSVNRTLKSLDKSIDLETDKLFDKIRDLKIGAALNDILSIIASLGAIGWGLSKAENNEERISIALKYGIPAIGAITTALLFTVGLVPAGPSLVLGLVAGGIINKLGEMADNARKKYKEQQPIVNIPNVDLRSPIKDIEEIKNHASGSNKSSL